MDTQALRQKIIDLAIRGKLVPQDPNDEPAAALLKRIHTEKLQMVKDGKLKAKDIQGDTVIFNGEDNLHYEKFQDGTVKCIENEIPFEIPDGWIWCRGYSCFWGMESKKPDGKFFEYIDIDSIDNKRHCVLSPKKILSSQAPSRASRKLKNGCIIFSMVRPYLENIAYIDEQLSTCIASTGFYICNPLPLVDAQYLFLLMTSGYIINGLNQFMKGDNSPSIRQKDIENWLYPIPPLYEQKRIVDFANRSLSLNDDITKRINELKSTISITKAKILDLAIRGKLVPQDPNDEPASVLIERISAEKEKLIKQGKIKRDKNDSVIYKGDDNSYYANIPKNWSWTSLREITNGFSLNDGDWILSENMDENGSVKLIQLGSVGFMRYVDNGFKHITEAIFEKLSCTPVKPGYMLINRIISNKMCVCILPEIDGKLITTVDTCWISPNAVNYNLKYILYVLSSPQFQSLVKLSAGGNTRKRISKTNLISLPIPFPPLMEQQYIVNVIEKTFSYLDHILKSLT